jgi:hypothetical protein
VEALNEANGGEITTVAPARKLDPTSVMRTWLAPCTGNPGDALVKDGEAAGLATASVTALDVSLPPVTERSETVTGSEPAEVTREAGTVAVNCVALVDDGVKVIPLI